MIVVHLKMHIVSSTVIALTIGSSALAQDDPQTPIPEPQLPAPTETIPEQIYPCNPGNYVPSPELGLPDVPPAVDCGELIVPPAGLDPDIEMTPPDPSTGTLRIVPPSDLEPQN